MNGNLRTNDALNFLFQTFVDGFLFQIDFLFFLHLRIQDLFDQALGLTDTELFIEDFHCRIVLELFILQRQQRTHMTGCQHFIDNHLLYPVVQFQETHRVCNRRSALGNALCDFILAEMELFHQAFVCMCLLNRVQGFSLNIFNQGNLDNFLLGKIFDDDRYFFDSGKLCSPPSPFPCDDLIIIIFFLHQNRL